MGTEETLELNSWDKCKKGSKKENLHCSKPKGVSTYTCREIALHRMWKFPISTKPMGIHISPLGLILKKNKPGK